MRTEKAEESKRSEMMTDKDIFCSIIERRAPAIRIFETELAVTIMDLSGYPLVLSRSHSDKNIPQILELAGKMIPAVQKAYHADGVRIQLNEGEAAGQEILHPHVHVMPRQKIEGGVGRTMTIKDNLEKEKMARQLKISLQDLADKYPNRKLLGVK